MYCSVYCLLVEVGVDRDRDGDGTDEMRGR